MVFLLLVCSVGPVLLHCRPVGVGNELTSHAAENVRGRLRDRDHWFHDGRGDFAQYSTDGALHSSLLVLLTSDPHQVLGGLSNSLESDNRSFNFAPEALKFTLQAFITAFLLSIALIRLFERQIGSVYRLDCPI